MHYFFCPCGYSYKGPDIEGLDHEPEPGGCCNCGGQRCMGCVFREYDHDCREDCPDCCQT